VPFFWKLVRLLHNGYWSGLACDWYRRSEHIGVG
jgi:hypothetical protein